ncbi:protein of unassigned function [Methylobacterium oryzae CBMB20]|uniref:Protein of unassigned function n=1 Tax=Methylobacterium oryzae CBMB20 TaxID=693986 RepID=A0A089NWQ4_9HYPH|nr:protein of unassigned function [Methylobacterium oryzae CBMB20]
MGSPPERGSSMPTCRMVGVVGSVKESAVSANFKLDLS